MRLGRHQHIQMLGRVFSGQLIVNDIPVEMVSGQKLLQIETTSLFQEFGFACVRSIVVERD